MSVSLRSRSSLGIGCAVIAAVAACGSSRPAVSSSGTASSTQSGGSPEHAPDPAPARTNGAPAAPQSPIVLAVDATSNLVLPRTAAITFSVINEGWYWLHASGGNASALHVTRGSETVADAYGDSFSSVLAPGSYTLQIDGNPGPVALSLRALGALPALGAVRLGRRSQYQLADTDRGQDPRGAMAEATLHVTAAGNYTVTYERTTGVAVRASIRQGTHVVNEQLLGFDHPQWSGPVALEPGDYTVRLAHEAAGPANVAVRIVRARR